MPFKDKAREKAWRRAHYLANRERILPRQREYELANRARRDERVTTWCAENHERSLEIKRQWQKRNPHATVARTAKYRAAKLGATPGWYGEIDEFAFQEAAHLCKLREEHTGFKWDVDHVVPLRSKLVCGLHVFTNMQVIPARLNQSKGNRAWPDMPGVI